MLTGLRVWLESETTVGGFGQAGKRGDEVMLDLPLNVKRGVRAGSVSDIACYDTSNSSLMIIN